jgi:aldehyde:ferredoxin oxidoreductase
MTTGYRGRFLRVDLSAGRLNEVSFDEATLREYIGGTGLGVKLLYEEVPPGVDWKDPENRLIIASGPLGGTSVKGSGTISLVTKGAMTGGATSSQANGFLGAYLRHSGFDGIILQGASPKLVYLYLHDGGAELRDASHLAGRDTWETEDLIKKELGRSEHQMSVFGIGPAGENLVRFAAVVGDRGHVAPHNGTGAVMGSKRLKAIAVARSRGRVEVKDGSRLRDAAERMFQTIKDDPAWSRVYEWGMLRGVVEGEASGTLLVKNYSTNLWGVGEEVLNRFTGPHIRSRFQPKPHPCWACSMHHCHLLTIPDGPYKGYVGEEPEAEGLAAWGPLIGQEDVAAMIVLNNEVDRLGMDTNEAGWVVSLVMELYEKGILTKKDTGGLEMNWGNAESARAMLYRIARREGLGDVLADGAMRASRRLGKEALDMAIYTLKGNSPRSHDHRARWIEMFDTMVSNTGTLECDVAVRADQLGIDPIRDNFSPQEVSSFIARSKGSFQFLDSLGICKFPNRTVPPLLIEMLDAATGWDFTWEEAMRMGRKVVNIMRAFNLRHGIAPEVEAPSPRYSSTPADGAAQGKSITPVLGEMMDNYYALMGWDRSSGRPLQDTLKALGLEHIIPALWP